jgi:predicted acylesterase/phospholipase RssA
VSRIAIALSGGGHRAALFGLGVLLFLADAERNRSVTSIASVSGGSLTNGFVAQSLDYSKATPAEFHAIARRLAQQLVKGGTLWATPFTWAYLALLGLTALTAVVGIWFLPMALPLRLILFFFAVLIVGWIAGWRGEVCVRAFVSTLLNRDGQATRLADVHKEIDHVLCAADLHWGEHVYFSGRFVCAYRYGWGVPGGISLAEAVHASAAYPGGFPARWVPTKGHGFREPGDERAAEVRALALVDGGAYDNMADEWGLGVAERNRRWAALEPGLAEPDELVVVNASGPLDYRPLGRLRLPVFGEALTLKRDIDLLYDTTTSVRRRWLFDTFVAGHPLRGAIIQISQSPFRVPKSFVASGDERAVRAQAVLAALGGTESEWEARVKRSRGVKTTLSRIPAALAADLVYHGYVLAMANLHVLLAHPLIQPPPASWFTDLVAGERSETSTASGPME